MKSPEEFARNWIDDWNSHDLERILGHYAETLEFHSPKVAIYTEGKKAFFASRTELRPYFARALINRPNLHFELIQVAKDRGGIAIVYKNDVDAIGVEIMDLNASGQVAHARVLYGAPMSK